MVGLPLIPVTALIIYSLLKLSSTVKHFAELQVFTDILSVITVRRYALHGLIHRNSVRPSVRPSVCHTRGLCPHGSTYDHDFFAIW